MISRTINRIPKNKNTLKHTRITNILTLKNADVSPTDCHVAVNELSEDKTLVTCKIKHFQKCFRAVDFPGLYYGRKNVVKTFYYLRQVNEVNGGDNAFVRYVSVCLFVCVFVCAQRPVMGVKC